MKRINKIAYIVFVLVLFILALPVLLIISLGLLLFSGFPIVYHQKRVGKSGVIFIIYKFRTMVKNAENLKSTYLYLNEADGPVFKIHNDPRLTRIGRFLSHTGLDELPQLINVIKGDMSLIGPRPLPIIEAQKLKSWQQKRQQIKPGIISPWIFEGYHTKSFNDWMKSDIYYIQKKSLIYDGFLLSKAVSLMVKLFFRELTRVFKE